MGVIDCWKSSGSPQLHIDGESVRWRRGIPAAEKLLSISLKWNRFLKIYRYEFSFRFIYSRKPDDLLDVLQAVLHIKIFVIVEGVVIKSTK